jgi:hypothetical protein
MSLMVRTFNVDLANALNGVTGLKDLDREDTLALHEATNDNPISMDVIGDITAVKRDFNAVAELMRIVRQDAGMKSGLPEEELWSSDRGAFSSGDQTEGIHERQWEGIKYMQGEIEDRCRNIAMLEVINALGKDRKVLNALRATRIEFLSPKIVSAAQRAENIKELSEAAFNLVASGMKLDAALDIVLRYGDDHLEPTAAIMEKIKEGQKELDEREEENHEADLAIKKKQAEADPTVPGGGAKTPTVREKAGYTKLEQRKHEKTRGGAARKEGLQKAKGKQL